VYRLDQYWCDILLVVVLAAIAGLASYQGAQFIDPSIFNEDPLDVDSTWFEADVVRAFTNMSDRSSNHYRTKVHPLFPLISYAPVYTLKKTLGLQAVNAVQIVIASVASLWIGALFILLRLVGCRKFDALSFSVLAMTGAAAIFWFVVPAKYSFGSLSILLALCLVAMAQHHKLSDWWYVSLSALTLSFTVTNWMAGILATLVNHPWKRALQLIVNAFCLVVLLWDVQKLLFPGAIFFIGDHEDAQFILAPDSGGLLHVLMSFVFHTMVMPAFEVIDRYKRPDWPVIITQFSSPGSGTP
jgi:hypothetical protein